MGYEVSDKTSFFFYIYFVTGEDIKVYFSIPGDTGGESKQ
jgi:hypothetical protein